MLTKVRVTGKYIQADGVTPASGRITFRLAHAILDAAGSVIATPIEETAAIQADGTISIELVATDDAGVRPAGNVYLVSERVSGAGNPRVYSIEVPSASATLDLATVVPATTTPSFTYALQSALTQGLADAAADATTKADAAQAAAETTAATALSSHNAATQNVHGLPDVAFLKRVSRVSVAAANALTKHYQTADFKCDGNTDGATINAAISEMAARGGAVELSYDTFAIEAPIILPSRIELRGQGRTATTLRMNNAANLRAVVETANYDALAAANAWFVDTQGMIYGFTLRGFQIDGNKANQTSGDGGARIWAKGFIADDLIIRDCFGIGWYSNGGTLVGQNDWRDMPETVIGPVWVRNCGGAGMECRGPHDAIITYLVSAANGGHGLYAAHGGEILFCHNYANGGDGINVDSKMRAVFLQGETNTGYGVRLTSNAPSSVIETIFGHGTSSWGGKNSLGGLRIDGDDVVVHNALFYSGIGAHIVHITGDRARVNTTITGCTPSVSHVRLGDVGLPINQCIVNATVNATQARTLSIPAEGIGNIVTMTATKSGSAADWDGNKGTTDIVTYNGGASSLSQNSGLASIGSAATSVDVTHNLVRTPNLSEIQVTPASSLGSAAVYWISNVSATTFRINVNATPGAQVDFSWHAALLAAGEPGGPAATVSDTFTATDGTALTAHATDTGETWSYDVGGFTITGNQVVPNVAGDNRAYLETGLSDGTFQVLGNLGADTGEAKNRHLGIIYRRSATNSYWYLRLYRPANSAAADLALIKTVTGTTTEVTKLSISADPSAFHELKVVVSGNSHTAYLNGVSVLSATDSALATATGAGIRCNMTTAAVPAGMAVDDLEVFA